MQTHVSFHATAPGEDEPFLVKLRIDVDSSPDAKATAVARALQAAGFTLEGDLSVRPPAELREIARPERPEAPAGPQG